MYRYDRKRDRMVKVDLSKPAEMPEITVYHKPMGKAYTHGQVRNYDDNGKKLTKSCVVEGGYVMVNYKR